MLHVTCCNRFKPVWILWWSTQVAFRWLFNWSASVSRGRLQDEPLRQNKALPAHTLPQLHRFNDTRCAGGWGVWSEGEQLHCVWNFFQNYYSYECTTMQRMYTSTGEVKLAPGLFLLDSIPSSGGLRRRQKALEMQRLLPPSLPVICVGIMWLIPVISGVRSIYQWFIERYYSWRAKKNKWKCGRVNNRVRSISVLLRMIRKCDPVSVFCCFFFCGSVLCCDALWHTALSSQPSRRGGVACTAGSCSDLSRFLQGKMGRVLLPSPSHYHHYQPTPTTPTPPAKPTHPLLIVMGSAAGPDQEARDFFSPSAHAACCFVNTSGNCRTACCKPGGRRSEMVDVVTKSKSGSRASSFYSALTDPRWCIAYLW